MRLKKLKIENFRSVKSGELEFKDDDNLTLLSGSIGFPEDTSSLYSAINHLCWNWVRRLNTHQTTHYRSLNDSLIKSGETKLEISLVMDMGGEEYVLKKEHEIGQSNVDPMSKEDKELYDNFMQAYLKLYKKKSNPIPVFASYSKHRSVPYVSVETRNDFDFSKWGALKCAMEYRQNFKEFFEWFRNQEDYEFEKMMDLRDLDYRDPKLECVKKAIKAFFPEIVEIKVDRLQRKLMVVEEDNLLNVEHMAEEDKELFALVGDLAMRLALANRDGSNPLKGNGIVLVERANWGYDVLNTFVKTFPNIQFIMFS